MRTRRCSKCGGPLRGKDGCPPCRLRKEAGLKTLTARKEYHAAVKRGADQEELTRLWAEVEGRTAAEELVSK